LERKNLWILKPVGLNRGQGIHVVDSLKKCKKLMKEYFYGREYIVGGHTSNTINDDDKCTSPIGTYVNKKI
jgi:phosphoribosylamine-glycine ligase